MIGQKSKTQEHLRLTVLVGKISFQIGHTKWFSSLSFATFGQVHIADIKQIL